MKRLLLIAALAATTMGCKTTSNAYEQAKLLKYPPAASEEDVLAEASYRIKPLLKDPDSLKNVTISNAYKCYASKMGVADNVSPKYDYGYWCYFLTYNATNSYGGYVKEGYDLIFDGERLLTVEQLGETVRKHDDVWTYRSPMN
ncbi:hypothetical protein [Pseudoalteromonas sp. BDTF-M6]|uniref:hypothetical protein n=1 Tax=Pseudoalteromonas sp. BDTF-M6 TaxID=2796132 RepID=UPI001BAF2225|nr:hypothetical protein [Pseudoalteromonas sp. BDTF-M6]MBS3796685.1 hypothetical protein [Pseudoalteromonas sp. BDTF-M6]